jgi:Tol biopolymer transport system component
VTVGRYVIYPGYIKGLPKQGEVSFPHFGVGFLYDLLRGVISMKRALILLLACLMMTILAAPAFADTLELVSSTTYGSPGDFTSALSDVSADGRYVVFLSWADDLVPYDTNNYWDIFVRDLWTGEMTRVNVDSDGVEAESPPANYAVFISDRPAISGDGRYVAFSSLASNLVQDDTNNSWDIFVHDMVSGETTRVSLDPTGHQFNYPSWYFTISGNGRYVAFSTFDFSDDSHSGLYLYDQITGTTKLLPFSQPNSYLNNGVRDLSLSADGRYLSFYTYVADLDSKVNLPKVFIYDTVDLTYHLVSSGETWDTSYGWSPSISADGRFISFLSSSEGLDARGSQEIPVELYVVDRITGAMERVIPFINSGSEFIWDSVNPRLSGNGRFVVFGGTLYSIDKKTKTHLAKATLLYDRQFRYTEVLAMNADFPAISADGGVITFADYNVTYEGNPDKMADVYAYIRDDVAGSPCYELDGIVEILLDMTGTNSGKFLSIAHMAQDACEIGDAGFAIQKLEVLIGQLKGGPGKGLDPKETEIAISLAQSFIDRF